MFGRGDDVKGFLSDDELWRNLKLQEIIQGRSHTGRITLQTLGKAYSLIPGKHKLNLHAIYLDTDEKSRSK